MIQGHTRAIVEGYYKGKREKGQISFNDIDKEELINGIAVEYEHIGNGEYKPSRKEIEDMLNAKKRPTEDFMKAMEIALDHLAESPEYYTYLEDMEKDMPNWDKRNKKGEE